MVPFWTSWKKFFSNIWNLNKLKIDSCETDSNYIVLNCLCTRISQINFYKSTEKLSFKLLQYLKHSPFSPCVGSLFAQRVLTVYSACNHRAFSLHTRYIYCSQLCVIRSACANRSHRVHDQRSFTLHCVHVCAQQLFSVCSPFRFFFGIFIVIRNIKVLSKKGHKMIMCS